MTLKSIPYPIRWRSQLDSTRCTELFATSTSSDRKSTRLNSSHSQISYAVFCLKKKKHQNFLINHTLSPRQIGLRGGLHSSYYDFLQHLLLSNQTRSYIFSLSIRHGLYTLGMLY